MSSHQTRYEIQRSLLKQAYNLLITLEKPPENVGGIDRLQRHLDCAVIEMLHKTCSY